MIERNLIYVDNAATTSVDDRVLAAMMPYFGGEYGNPSSIYALGRRASLAVEQARDKIAQAIGASANELFFTSGGSEADNWAIKSGARLAATKGKKHIISTNIEHHAVLHTLDSLKAEGFEITLLEVGADGIILLDSLKQAIRPDTGLVTIMYANNEIGTIQPIKEVGQLCKEHEILFHTDAVQAVGRVNINVNEDNIDLMSASAHKLHGPKGIGFLYIRRGVRLANFIDGGAQERGRRGGTENVPAIVGFAKAVELALEDMDSRNTRLRLKTHTLIDRLSVLSHSRLNGHREKRLANNFNMSFEGIEGESLLLLLDNAGIAASSGSACTSGALDPSHVLIALGLPHEVAHGSLRITIDDSTTDKDIDYIIQQVIAAVDRLRVMSPLWDTIVAANK